MAAGFGPSHACPPCPATEARKSFLEANASRNITRTAQGYATGSTPGYTYTLVNPVSITEVDKNGNIREQIQATRASTIVNTITHTYNIESQPLSSSDVASGLVYTYDGLGRMATASNAGTTGVPEVVLTLAHNRLNERTDLGAQIGSTPDFANSYLHDQLGRISRITQTGQTGGNAVADKRADFTFGSLGYNIGISRHENLSTSNLVVSTSLSYDPFARLVGQEHVKESTPLGSYSVTYDANRRIDSMTTPDGLGEFDYDGSGQLLEADYDYQSDEDFSYDLTGNRTMTGYTTGPNNLLLAAGDLEFEYDGEGNRIKQTDTATDDYIVYQWDHRNRLTKVTFFDDTDTKTKEILYTYDTHNRRIRRQLDANGNGTIDSAQNIVYDAGWKPGLEDIVLIFDESDDLQHRFLQGPGIDQPLADEQPAKLHWLLPGQLGTITDVIEYTPGTDTTTNINHLTYTSFGQIASQTNSSHEPYYTYTAREWDGDAGRYFYRARWYDPSVGRFVSEDPIGFEGEEFNLSRYVFNCAVVYSDPSGNVGIWDFFCPPRPTPSATKKCLDACDAMLAGAGTSAKASCILLCNTMAGRVTCSAIVRETKKAVKRARTPQGKKSAIEAGVALCMGYGCKPNDCLDVLSALP